MASKEVILALLIFGSIWLDFVVGVSFDLNLGLDLDLDYHHHRHRQNRIFFLFLFQNETVARDNKITKTKRQKQLTNCSYNEKL